MYYSAMNRQAHWLWLGALVLLLSGLLYSRLPAAQAQAEPAFPYESGFPRHDPVGPTWSVSPTVVDLNGDGQLDILSADGAGCVWGWDRTGNLLPGFPWVTNGACSGLNRIRNPLTVGDLDGLPGLEVAAGSYSPSLLAGQRGKTYVWNASGQLLPGWPKEMDLALNNTSSSAEVGSVIFANVAGDAQLEVVAGTTNSGEGSGNLYVWTAAGELVPGFPTSYKTAGFFAQLAAADLNGDGLEEVLLGRDHIYVSAYTFDGSQLPGWPVQTYYDPDQTTWGQDKYVEFTSNPPAIGDIDGDGILDIVIAGKVRDPLAGVGDPVTAATVMVLQPDGTRHPNWKVPPLTGASLLNEVRPSHAPALADLDGDSKLEIALTLFDGTLRVYHADATQMWSYDFAQGKTLFASEPVIGDISNDGALDIVFGTYSPNGSANDSVALIGLDARTGTLLPGFPLPLTEERSNRIRGIMAAPTITNLDDDCRVELVASSMSGTVYVWQMPAIYDPTLMPWPTGRQNILRNGALPLPSAPGTTQVAPLDDPPGIQVYMPIVPRLC